MKSISLSLLISFISFFTVAQSLVINEFLASNNNDIIDNYGEYEDWIELYNPGASAINIAGLYITDDLNSPLLYQMPVGNDSTIIQAGEFLVLWADKDTEQGVLHIDFKLSGSGEQIGIFDAMGNAIDSLSFGAQNSDISYGRSPDGSNNWVFFSETTPGASNINYYLTPSPIAYSFPNTANNSLLITVTANVSWDVTSAVSWLSVNPSSGINDGSFTITVTEANTSENSRNAIISLSGSNVSTQEINITQLGVPVIPTLVINEFMANNNSTITDNAGEYDDWIELYNYGSNPVNIGGLYFTDDLSNPLKFQISDLYPDTTTIAAGGFLLLWADDDTEQGVLHTNFKLSNNGEQIGIYYSQFSKIDTLSYLEQFADTSYGLTWDGGNDWTFFSSPTPGYSNSLGINKNYLTAINTYPNPATNTLFLQTNDNKQKIIQVFNTQGELVLSKTSNLKNPDLKIKNLSKGIYHLSVTSETYRYTSKFIKL